MSEEQSDNLSVQIRASYKLTDDELILVDKRDYRIEFTTRVNFADLDVPFHQDATAIEFEVRNRIAELLENHPGFGDEDATRPWIEITQLSWRPNALTADEKEIPWLILPLMTPRQLVILYATAYKLIFDEN